MKITSGYGQITVGDKKYVFAHWSGTVWKYMGARNYNYQIPREGSHIYGSRYNAWKHWKTILKNKHCCHF